MKIFTDTGSLKDIEALASLGILDGVTTNPSLMAKLIRSRGVSAKEKTAITAIGISM